MQDHPYQPAFLAHLAFVEEQLVGPLNRLSIGI